jgi:uncharacterized phage protein (TIGR01671 family)
MKNTNRVIKFRAWDKDEKKMIIFCLEDLLDLQNKTETESFGIHDYACNRMYETIMQFTGIKDKNGKEVYEGDVVHLKDISGSGSERDFGLKEIKWGDVGFPESLLTEDIKVMGNIYQNPELIN